MEANIDMSSLALNNQVPHVREAQFLGWDWGQHASRALDYKDHWRKELGLKWQVIGSKLNYCLPFNQAVDLAGCGDGACAAASGLWCYIVATMAKKRKNPEICTTFDEAGNALTILKNKANRVIELQTQWDLDLKRECDEIKELIDDLELTRLNFVTNVSNVLSTELDWLTKKCEILLSFDREGYQLNPDTIADFKEMAKFWKEQSSDPNRTINEIGKIIENLKCFDKRSAKASTTLLEQVGLRACEGDTPPSVWSGPLSKSVHYLWNGGFRGMFLVWYSMPDLSPGHSSALLITGKSHTVFDPNVGVVQIPIEHKYNNHPLITWAPQNASRMQFIRVGLISGSA